jgi:hypothetical protein
MGEDSIHPAVTTLWPPVLDCLGLGAIFGGNKYESGVVRLLTNECAVSDAMIQADLVSLLMVIKIPECPTNLL